MASQSCWVIFGLHSFVVLPFFAFFKFVTDLLISLKINRSVSGRSYFSNDILSQLFISIVQEIVVRRQLDQINKICGKVCGSDGSAIAALALRNYVVWLSFSGGDHGTWNRGGLRQLILRYGPSRERRDPQQFVWALRRPVS